MTCKNVIEFYTGERVNQSGFCRCPLHDEKTGSMKLYHGDRGFYCFGCQNGGDVINLTMMLTGLRFKAACQKLSDDFHLGLEIDRPLTYDQRRELEVARIERQMQREEDEGLYNAAYQKYLDCIDDPDRQEEASYWESQLRR